MAIHAPIMAASSAASPVQVLLTQFDRERLEIIVEAAISLLDAIDGDPDQEDGDDAEAVNEDGSDTISPVLPKYGIDQSEGPINGWERHRAWATQQRLEARP